VFSPDGKLVYASAEDGDTVEVIDVERRAQTAQIKVGPRPRESDSARRQPRLRRPRRTPTPCS